MADLTITITEAMSGIGHDAGNEGSVSDTQTKTISGISSIYHYKGKGDTLYGSSHPVFRSHDTLNTGIGGIPDNLAYLRISNIDDGGGTLILGLTDEDDTNYYLELSTNKSFILFPKTGTTTTIDEHNTGSGTLIPTKYLKSIYFNHLWNDKDYEIFAAWIGGGD